MVIRERRLWRAGLRRVWGLALGLGLVHGLAVAGFPDHPVTLVVPFSAGGPTDKLARDLAQALGAALHQPVGVENVGGAGGTLGATKVAKAAPDGYTLLLYHVGMATAPSLYRNLPFNPASDFEYLGMLTEVPMTLIGRAALPPTDFATLLPWLRENAAKANLAHAGAGAASQLCALLLMQRLGLELATVPYKGTAPALADLLAGHVDLLCDQTSNTTEPITDGRVRAYAVTTLQPLKTPALARLPTLDSQGLKGFNITIWHGLYAPRGTPPDVTARLNAALRAALRDPEFVARQAAAGADVVADDRLSPAGHQRFVAAETARWRDALQASHP